MNGADILRLPMQPNDSGAITIGGYLQALLARLWTDGEGFSGKRPFGNSGWEDDLLEALSEVTTGVSPQVAIEMAIDALVPTEPVVVQATPEVPSLKVVEAVVLEMRDMRDSGDGVGVFVNEDDPGLIELRWRMPLSGGGDRILDVEARLESAYLFDTHTETMVNLMKDPA